MKVKTLLLLFCLIIFTQYGCFYSSDDISSVNQTSENQATSEIIVQFKSETPEPTKELLRESVNGNKTSEINKLNAEVWAIQGLEIEEAIEKLQQFEAVEYAEPNDQHTID
ncbi:MAG: hypothetical protein GY730_09625 [bacterium]|nr:hypothetical protein [bacterium]